MRSWIKCAIASMVLSGAVGCGNPEMPMITRGMTLQEKDKELNGRWPPVRPMAVRLKADGTMREVYVQKDVYTDTWIVVEHRNGVVTGAEYTVTGN